MPHTIRKIGFLGISDYGFGYLKKLVESEEYEVAFATSKSRPVPHIASLETELQDYCRAHDIPFLGNADANDPAFITHCKETDICIFGGYDKIVKSAFIHAPTHGVINTHFGLIPENRGCNPVLWAILENKPQGFTSYFVTESVDSGHTIERYTLSPGPRRSAYETYQLLCVEAINRFLPMLEKVKRGITVPHMGPRGTYHQQGMPNDSWISWQWTNEFLQRFSDALTFPPYPGARTEIRGMSVGVRIMEVAQRSGHASPGEVLAWDEEGQRMTVATKESAILCSIEGNPDIRKGDMCVSKVGNVHPIPLDFARNALEA
jgi:methionyl-tRNA formyltransferase